MPRLVKYALREDYPLGHGLGFEKEYNSRWVYWCEPCEGMTVVVDPNPMNADRGRYYLWAVKGKGKNVTHYRHAVLVDDLLGVLGTIHKWTEEFTRESNRR